MQYGFSKKLVLKFKQIKPLKIVDSSDVTFNLTNDTYRHKKLNNFLLYSLLCTSSNYLPQFIEDLLVYINERLKKKSSSEDFFHENKLEYETALRNSTYHNKESKSHKEEQNTHKRKRNRNILWFQPPFSRNVITNVAEIFHNLVSKHFPKSSKFQKIFKRNTHCQNDLLLHLSCIFRYHNKIRGHKWKKTKRYKM